VGVIAHNPVPPRFFDKNDVQYKVNVHAAPPHEVANQSECSC
jgi:hypothetical protein